MINLFAFGFAVLAGTWVVHQLEYGIEFGRRFGTEMATTPHHFYMGPIGLGLTIGLLRAGVATLSILAAGHVRVLRVRRRIPARSRQYLDAALPVIPLKIQSPGAFADAVRAFHLLPPGLVSPFAFLIPWLELLVAVCLISGFMSLLGPIGSIALLGMFLVGLLDSLLTGNTAHACGCFGAAGHDYAVISFLAGGNTVTSWDVIRDVILALVAAAVVWWGPGEISVEALVARHRQDDMEETAA